MLAAVAWAKRGAPALHPTTTDTLEAEGDEEERKVEAAPEKGGKRGKRAADEDDEDSDDDVPFAFVRQNLAFYKNNKDDPHLKLDEQDDDDSEIEDFSIQPTDLMLLGARSDEEMSNLEVYIYETRADNMYVHHDIPLPVFPLCLAWMDAPPAQLRGPLGGGRNFVAVGTFQPFIEVWNLDVLDALEPAAVLGGAGAEAALAAHEAAAAEHEAAGGGGKKKKKKSKAAAPAEAPAAEGHTDAVMALAWNPLQPNVLASGSADTTVRLWDLQGSLDRSAQTMAHHADKVQALAWHPVDASVLLTASFDRRVCALDVRAPSAVRAWALPADVECVQWNPHDAHYFVASCEDGVVKCFDARVEKKAVWTLQAHDGAASGLDFNPESKDLLATGGLDQQAKLWSLEGGKPAMLAARDMGLGVIFDLKWSADCPALLAAGGSLGKLGVWNTLETEAMQARLPQLEAPLDDEGRVMGSATAGMGALDVDSSGDEDEEGEDGAAGAAGAAGADDRATARRPEEDAEPEQEGEEEVEEEVGAAAGGAPRAQADVPPRAKKAGKAKAKVKAKGKGSKKR